ncbi:MAG: ATP-binding protein [Candidatus Bipolaricaulota bacterium]|nr:ATP-binding protein [Candidatus Bipolaricaulota bacterium]
MAKAADGGVTLAVASGKGGTGKTTVAVSLALAARDSRPVELVDCDVEEPNAHLFLSPQITAREPVGILSPEVDLDRCTFCGRCAEACRFGALAVVGRKVLFHPELCHGCGLCALACPEQAIEEIPRAIGWIEEGQAQAIRFLHGILDVGEPMATPIVRRLKERTSHDRVTVLDAPPGTGCPVIETLRGADFALLVTEPTPFGLHDLRLALAVTRILGIPAGVVISKDGIGTDALERYCIEADIPVLLRIPMDRRIAAAYAHGIPLLDALPEWKEPFLGLLEASLNGAKRVR